MNLQAGVAGRNARLPQRQGCLVGRSAGTCEQRQFGAVCIKANNITAGDFGLNQPRSPVLIAGYLSRWGRPSLIAPRQVELLPVVVMRLFLSERQIHPWLALT
jgi:hypothetical protein